MFGTETKNDICLSSRNTGLLLHIRAYYLYSITYITPSHPILKFGSFWFANFSMTFV